MTDTNKMHDAKQANAASAAAITETVRQTTDSAQAGSHAAGEAFRQGAALSADMTPRGTDAISVAMRRAGEATNDAVERNTKAVTTGHQQITQDAVQRFEQMSQKLIQTARGASENMNHLFTLPSAAEGGLRDMQKSVSSMVEGVVQTNLRMTQELLRFSNPMAMIELQQRFVSAYMEALLSGTTALVRAIRRTADEAVPALEARAAQHGAQAAE